MTIGYKVTVFGMLASFIMMFMFFNESVSQAIVPLSESSTDSIIADVNVTVRFLGYTGRCPPAMSAGEVYADRLESVGSSYKYTAGDITVEDTGFLGNMAPDQPEDLAATNAANVTNTTNTSYRYAKSIRGVGSPMLKWVPTWQDYYAKRTSHTVACEPGFLPSNTFPEYDPLKMNNSSGSRRLARGGGGGGKSSSSSSNVPRARATGKGFSKASAVYGSNGAYVGESNFTGELAGEDQSPVLKMKWTCHGCTLQRIGSLYIIARGVEDEYIVSTSLIEYLVEVSPVVPEEDNSLYGMIAPRKKTEVFHGFTPTTQEVTLMPATYTADKDNIFLKGSYRVGFGSSTPGKMTDSENFVDVDTNELKFRVEFNVGNNQFNTRIEPVMTMMNALCELGGLFGAIAGMYLGWLRMAEKHEKFLPGFVKQCIESFDRNHPNRQDEEVLPEDVPISFGKLSSTVERMHPGLSRPLVKTMSGRQANVPRRPVIGIKVGLRVEVVAASAPTQRKLNGNFGWVETLAFGDGHKGNHGFGVRMEGDGALYTVLRRYLQPADNQWTHKALELERVPTEIEESGV
jgi:hypothetical protein